MSTATEKKAAVGQEGGGLYDWFRKRFPWDQMMDEHVTGYYAPKNFNWYYVFGSLALLALILQIVTGIFLTMSYKPSAAEAFASVEYIMRDVEWGWLIRYMHSTGASLFFVVVYVHMFRALLYGSYQKPRELIWIFGMLIYLCMSAEAFFGYLLPWGQMSYWGAQVIVSLFGALPVIGEPLVEWIRGDYFISDVTLNRFFALHVIALPLVLLGLVVAHVLALHEVGSNNPDGVEIHTAKDVPAWVVFSMVFAAIVFFAPEMGGYFLEHANFEPADPLKTPDHIAPVWYFTPFYAILRAIPDKLGGVVMMGAAMFVLFLLPWLDRSPVRSIRYKGPLFKIALTVFTISFVMLGWLGLQPATGVYTMLARVFTVLYFAFFLLMPIYSKIDKTKTPPDRITYHG